MRYGRAAGSEASSVEPAFVRRIQVTLALRVRQLLDMVDLRVCNVDQHARAVGGGATPAAEAILSLAVQNMGPTVARVQLQCLTGDVDGPHRVPPGATRR